MPTRRRLGEPFRTLCTAAGLSSTGTGITDAAVPLYVLAVAGADAGPGALGVVAGAAALPSVVLALPSGVVADRYDRRQIMLGADLGRAACLVAFAVLALAGAVATWSIAVLALAVGAGQALFAGAAQPLLPTLVDDERLDDANGRLATATDVGGEFVGPPIGSALFTVAHAVPFAFDAVTYVASSILIGRLPRPPTPAGPRARPRLAPAVAAVRASRTLRSLWIALVVLALCNTTVSTILVLLLRDRIGLAERWFGVAFSAIAAGAVVAGLGTGRAVAALGARATITLAIVVNLAAYVTLGLTERVAVAFVALVVWGLAVTTGTIVAMSIRQRRTRDEIRGRVMSLFRFGTALGALIGALAAGALASWIGPSSTVVTAGAVQLVTVVVVLAGVRDVEVPVAADPAPTAWRPGADDLTEVAGPTVSGRSSRRRRGGCGR